MTKYYKFADTIIKITSKESIAIPENMMKFETPESNYNHSYNICVDDDLDKIKSWIENKYKINKKIKRENMLILVGENLEVRMPSLYGEEQPYALTLDNGSDNTKIWLISRILHMLSIDTVFGSLLSLEKRVLCNNAFVLHSSYICVNNKAVLFTAPSGTGKSTQAELWKKYKGAEIVNGDRSLIVKEDEGWFAYGWPICGSSEICFNKKHKVDAIVILNQAEENTVVKTGGFSAAKMLIKEITVNMWNILFQDKILGLVEKLIEEVDVYEFKCNITKEAVEDLYCVLKNRNK